MILSCSWGVSSETWKHDADVTAQGQLWIKNTTPNELWFTDDGGTDHQLGVGGASADHTALTNIGTNTHPQIDTHIANVANPHSVDIDDVTPTTTKGDIIVENAVSGSLKVKFQIIIA